MKILYLTQVLPYPPDSGGKIKTYQTLRFLSKKHQVYLVCFTPQSRDLTYQRNLQRLCAEVKVFVSNTPFDHFRNIHPIILKSLFLPEPFIVHRYRDGRFKKAVEEILEKEKIDAIHIDHLNMASYLPKKKDCLWVFEEHNLESEINWGIVKRERWNKFKFFSLIEGLKMVIYERVKIPRFDYLFAISESDRKKLIIIGARENRVFFLPTPFKTKPLFDLEKSKPIILFVGLLAWWPNKDGLLWFYEKVFPLVKQKIPKAELMVVGKEATKEMFDLDEKDPCFNLVGYVKDLDKYLSQAGVFVSPMRAGSGIRIKILTTLSVGLPVVSTTKGAEGIVDKASNGIILADSPEDFSQAVIDILKNKKLAEKLSKAGLDFVKRNFNQQKATNVLKKVYP